MSKSEGMEDELVYECRCGWRGRPWIHCWNCAWRGDGAWDESCPGCGRPLPDNYACANPECHRAEHNSTDDWFRDANNPPEDDSLWREAMGGK